ncbi:MAG: C39 family peptidase [Candidatus Sericytochromatia bacterium]|nr:C39 family peptidase [Candidatus Sericytochromatia bacterium]
MAAGFAADDAQRIFAAVRVRSAHGVKPFDPLAIRVAGAGPVTIAPTTAAPSTLRRLPVRSVATTRPVTGLRTAVIPGAIREQHTISGVFTRDQHEGDPLDNNNACGTNALWSVLAFYKGQENVDFRTLDRTCRAVDIDMGVSPRPLAAYARRIGLAASIHHGTTTYQMRQLIDAGLPVIILTNPKYEKGGSTMHYLVVYGYDSLDDSKTTWTVGDPNKGIQASKVKNADLMPRWHHIRLEGIETPLNNVMLTLAPPARKHLLPSNNADRLERFAMGVSDVAVQGGKLVEHVGRGLKTARRILSGTPTPKRPTF